MTARETDALACGEEVTEGVVLWRKLDDEQLMRVLEDAVAELRRRQKRRCRPARVLATEIGAADNGLPES